LAGVGVIRHIVAMKHSSQISRRDALSLGASAIAAPLIIKSAEAASDNPVLVELFTSQGCSSCPAADKLAAALTGATVVSFNVDYWDYLGWRDTLAKPEYTQRQMDYAKSRGDNDVYTPQMIIDGAAHAVGSSQAAVTNAISAAYRVQAKVPMTLKANDMELIVDLGAGEAVGEATLWLMAIAPSVVVKVERGENSGKEISYHNVVRKLVPAGMWNGQSAKLTFPRSAIITDDVKMCLAVLQTGKVGPVLGLAKWSEEKA
jgi:hypothetical protein